MRHPIKEKEKFKQTNHINQQNMIFQNINYCYYYYDYYSFWCDFNYNSWEEKKNQNTILLFLLPKKMKKIINKKTSKNQSSSFIV